MIRRKTGIHQLYSAHPEYADLALWGRKSDPVTRRGFLHGSGYAALSAVLGASIPFASLMPAGLIPAALAESDQPFEIPGKEGLVVLNDRPINAETPPWLLDDKITPAARMFVRNNGIPPDFDIDPEAWTLKIACNDGKMSLGNEWQADSPVAWLSSEVGMWRIARPGMAAHSERLRLRVADA